jgi:hypothetical protein
MSKIFGPWKKYPSYFEETWVRPILGTSGHYPVNKHRDNLWGIGIIAVPTYYDTKEKAMNAIDQAILRQYPDAVFLTQEQWDKLSVLL